MEFRTDINGLRAYAVLGVVLYHFGVTGIDGGFAGVDVFFVISGFLMTGIILAKLERHAFSLTEFYASRARRIVPALLALCAALLLLGYFWLSPGDYGALGKHAAAATGFVSNIVFANEAGYFDGPSKEKWLLHTWSLSVEWQFYLLYPLALAACYRKGPPTARRLVFVLAALAALSLLASLLATPKKPSDAFFLLPARIWEFMAGGAAWLALRHDLWRGNRATEIAGVAMILASFVLFDSGTAWPGYAALLPVAGTTLVILAARDRSLLTGTAPMQAIGNWSYSIYLWHWPVVVALAYVGVGGAGWTVGGIALSIVLGALSYRLVETPLRRAMARWPSTPTRAGIVIAALVVIAGGLLVRHTDGLHRAVPAGVAEAEQAQQDRYVPAGKCGYDRKTDTIRRCVVGNGEHPAFALWGDSHAPSVITAVRDAAGGQGLLYTHVCPTILDVRLKAKSANHPCKEFNDAVLADIRTLPADVPVIIINRFSYYLHGYNEAQGQVFGLNYLALTTEEEQLDDASRFRTRLAGSLCRIAENRRVYVVQPVAEMGRDVPKLIARHLMAGRGMPDIGVTREAYRQRHADTLAALQEAHTRCGVTLLDPWPFLCENERCPGIRDGKSLYFDDDHLNESGNRYLVPMFQEVFREATRPALTPAG